VYAVCAAIPRGRVGTYGGLSAALGRGSARAVGQAMRKNPFAPRVPCHRVIAASRAIGGFAGEAGPPGGGGGGGGMTTAGGHVARKRAMLRGEGVRFESDEPGEAGYWAVARACVLSTDEMAALVLAARAAADGGGEEEEEEDGGGVGGGGGGRWGLRGAVGEEVEEAEAEEVRERVRCGFAVTQRRRLHVIFKNQNKQKRRESVCHRPPERRPARQKKGGGKKEMNKRGAGARER